jgi:hypothetical protein
LIKHTPFLFSLRKKQSVDFPYFVFKLFFSRFQGLLLSSLPQGALAKT